MSDPGKEPSDELFAHLDTLRASAGTRELVVERLATVRAGARVLIKHWNERDQTAAECAAELRGMLVGAGVLSEQDYYELLHPLQRGEKP